MKTFVWVDIVHPDTDGSRPDPFETRINYTAITYASNNTHTDAASDYVILNHSDTAGSVRQKIVASIQGHISNPGTVVFLDHIGII